MMPYALDIFHEQLKVLQSHVCLISHYRLYEHTPVQTSVIVADGSCRFERPEINDRDHLNLIIVMMDRTWTPKQTWRLLL